MTEKLIQFCKSHITKFKRQRPLRAQSLLMTIYGDSILPYGGEIWLGSLINLAAPFGINQRLVRTSVYRLMQDEWVGKRKIGRRSYYYLAESAKDNVMLAEKRIYHKSNQSWDEEWLLVFIGVEGVSSEKRIALRRELMWQGFGQISVNVFGHPVADIDSVIDILKKRKVEDKVVVMKAKNFDKFNGPGIVDMVNQCFVLDAIKKNYNAFIGTYDFLHKNIDSIKNIDSKTCFIMKTLLIHDYRKITLRDPQLPSDLLDTDWPGNNAFQLCGSLYNEFLPGAENYLLDECETVTGRFAKSSSYYATRFDIK